MDSAEQLRLMLEIFERLGVEIRHLRLGGSGSNLCTLKGKQILFLDMDADKATQLDGCAAALSRLPASDEIFVPPEIRQRIDQMRRMDK